MDCYQACTDLRHRLYHALSCLVDAGQLIQARAYDFYGDLVLAQRVELAKLHDRLVGNSGECLLKISDELHRSIAWSGARQCDLLLDGGICLRPVEFSLQGYLLRIDANDHYAASSRYTDSAVYSF